METAQLNRELRAALETDSKRKAWIMPNHPLFVNSEEHADMFLTTYRFRNAYEDVLDRHELGENIWDERDRILIMRYFEMMFYPPRRLSLTQWKNNVDPTVRIVRAYKDRRWKGNSKRPYEITLVLDDGAVVQLNPNEILNKYFHILNTVGELRNSNL
jgi:hypothetical protein